MRRMREVDAPPGEHAVRVLAADRNHQAAPPRQRHDRHPKVRNSHEPLPGADAYECLVMCGRRAAALVGEDDEPPMTPSA